MFLLLFQFCLMVLTTTATVMGCMETLSACVVDEWPSMKPYKPAIVFTFLALLFMINLVMATQGGIYIYYLISTYYTTWPLIFFGLLTVLAAAFSHGGKYLMKDLSDMSKLPLTHYINSHLSVLYITVIPIFLSVSTYLSDLAWHFTYFLFVYSAHLDIAFSTLLVNTLLNLWKTSKWLYLKNGVCRLDGLWPSFQFWSSLLAFYSMWFGKAEEFLLKWWVW